jgi:hypothetical protein
MSRKFLASVLLFAGVTGALAILAFGQGQPVNQVSGPPTNNYVTYYDLGSTPQYICYAQALQPPGSSFYLSSGTLVSIAVSTNVGTITFGSTSYLWTGAVVNISGATVATALNGSYSITAVSGSTATIATSGVGNATYTDATLVLTTSAPLLNQSVWSILVTQYSGSNPITQYWAGNPAVTPPMNLACSNRHNY